MDSNMFGNNACSNICANYMCKTTKDAAKNGKEDIPFQAVDLSFLPIR